MPTINLNTGYRRCLTAKEFFSDTNTPTGEVIENDEIDPISGSIIFIDDIFDADTCGVNIHDLTLEVLNSSNNFTVGSGLVTITESVEDSGTIRRYANQQNIELTITPNSDSLIAFVSIKKGAIVTDIAKDEYKTTQTIYSFNITEDTEVKILFAKKTTLRVTYVAHTAAINGVFFAIIKEALNRADRLMKLGSTSNPALYQSYNFPKETIVRVVSNPSFRTYNPLLGLYGVDGTLVMKRSSSGSYFTGNPYTLHGTDIFKSHDITMDASYDITGNAQVKEKEMDYNVKGGYHGILHLQTMRKQHATLGYEELPIFSESAPGNNGKSSKMTSQVTYIFPDGTTAIPYIEIKNNGFVERAVTVGDLTQIIAAGGIKQFSMPETGVWNNLNLRFKTNYGTETDDVYDKFNYSIYFRNVFVRDYANETWEDPKDNLPLVFDKTNTVENKHYYVQQQIQGLKAFTASDVTTDPTNHNCALNYSNTVLQMNGMLFFYGSHSNCQSQMMHITDYTITPVNLSHCTNYNGYHVTLIIPDPAGPA